MKKKHKKYTLTSVVSAPKRGKYGSSKFPGNCSGLPIKLLLLYFKPKRVLDPMEGGRTCREVCEELGIEYDGYDLLWGQDMYSMKFERKYDFIHWHPPYYRFNMKAYEDICPDPRNLAFIKKWDKYIEKLKEGYDILFNALTDRGILAILLGMRRISGKVYDPAPYLIIHGADNFIGEIIKLQHNILHKARFGSGYSKLQGLEGVVQLDEDLSEENFAPVTFHGNPFILIVHEKYLLFQKRG